MALLLMLLPTGINSLLSPTLCPYKLEDFSGHLGNGPEWPTKMWFIFLSILKDTHQALTVFFVCSFGG